MLTLQHTKTYYTPTEAEALAEILTADSEDDWTYVANHDPKGTGSSFIDIYDEDGEHLGVL